MQNFWIKFKYSPTLFAVPIVVGVFFRFFQLDRFATFGHDNSRDLIILYKLAHYKEWIFRGPVFSVVWAHLSPVYYYILFPFYFLMNFHPLSPAIFTVLLNIIALISIAFVSFKVFGKKASIVSSFIYAVSFLVIKEGAFGLNPCFLPAVSIFLFYVIYKFVIGEERYLPLISFCVAVLVSFHPSGFFVVPLLFVLYVVYRPRLSKNFLWRSVLVFGLLAIVPYLIQEKKFAWWDVKKVVEYFLSKENGTAGIGTYTYISNFIQTVINNISETLFPGLNQLGFIFGVIILASILYYSTKIRKKQNSLTLISIMIVVYLFVFGGSIKFNEVGLHEAWFQTVLIPWVIIFIGGLFSFSKNRWSSWLIILVLGAILMQNMKAYFNYVPERDTFFSQKKVSQAISSDADGRDFDIYGTDPEPINYLLWYYEKDPQRKQMYYAWIKWSKERDSTLAYFVQDKYKLTDGFIQLMSNERGLLNYSEIFRFADRVVYKFE